MPEGEASHPRPGNPCGVCWGVNDENGTPLRGHDLGCGGNEQLHWFCSPCIANLWSCPFCGRSHPLCTAPPPRETQAEDLTLDTLRTLIQQNVWNNGAVGDSRDVEWLDVLTEEGPATPPPHPPWRARTWALPTKGADPTSYIPDSEHYDDAPRGSLPPMGNLPNIWGPGTSMNFNNYRTTVVTLTNGLPFAFSWLVGDAEWAMGIVRSAHGGEWGDFFHRSGAMTPGATKWLMGLAHMEGHTPPPQPPTIGTARPTAARPTAAAGHARQCSSGQNDGRKCPAPQLLLLLSENRDHQHPPTPIPCQNSD